MRLFIAVLLNVVFSVGGFILLIMNGFNVVLSFLIFLVALIPFSDFLVSIITGVKANERIFK